MSLVVLRDDEKMNIADANTSKNFLYKALGNAITVGVVEVLIEGVLHAMRIKYAENPTTKKWRQDVWKNSKMHMQLKKKTTVAKVEYFTYLARK